MTPWLAALGAALAVGLLLPGRARPARPVGPVGPPGDPSAGDDRDWMRDGRVLWTACAGVAGPVVVGGTPGLLAGLVLAVAVWTVIGRAEPAARRRERAETRRDLPQLTHLLAAALHSGAPAAEGLALACSALPGAAADRLGAVSDRLALGVDPVTVWTAVAGDQELAPLGRALARSHTTGASVVPTLARLADELDRRARADVEDRARAVGVRAALPLGLCLLPAFVLLGIVPLVAALVSSLAW